MWLLANAQNTQQVLQNGISTQQAVSQAMSQLWNDTLNSPMYIAIADIGVFFFTGTLAIFLLNWIKGVFQDEHSPVPWEQWILLAVAVALLANQGALMKTLTFSLRDLMNATNEKVLQSSLINGADLISAFNQVASGAGVQSWYNQQVQSCQMIPDPTQQQQCLNNAQALANQLAQQGGSSNLPNPSGLLSGVGSAIETALVGLLFALGVAVQWLVEISWILTAFAGPIAVGGTLLPVKQKSLFAWLIAFYSVGLYKLFFNILTGMVAMVMLKANNVNNLIFAVAVGLLSPILALVLAAGGGLTTFTSLASIGGAVAGAVATGGASLAAGGATMATRMAAHPAMRRASSTYQQTIPAHVRKRIRGRVRDATTPIFRQR